MLSFPKVSKRFALEAMQVCMKALHDCRTVERRASNFHCRRLL